MIRKEERQVEKAVAEERRSNEIKSREREAFFGVEKIATSLFFDNTRNYFFVCFCFVCIVYTKYRLMFFTYRVMVDSDKPSMRTSSMPCVL